MSLRDALLAVLTLGECHGSRLAAEVAARSGARVNPGQVQKTLARLVAEGLAEMLPRDTQGRIPVVLTDAGRRAAAEWLAESSIDRQRLRLAASLPGVDRDELLDREIEALRHELGAAPAATGLSDPPRRGRPSRTV